MEYSVPTSEEMKETEKASGETKQGREPSHQWRAGSQRRLTFVHDVHRGRLHRVQRPGGRTWRRHKWTRSDYTKPLTDRSTMGAFSSWKTLLRGRPWLGKKNTTRPSHACGAGRQFRILVVRADHPRNVFAAGAQSFRVEARTLSARERNGHLVLS